MSTRGFFREWRRQVTTLTKNGAKKPTNPMIPDSELIEVRLTREAEFKLHMAKSLREAGLKTRDRGFLQSRCQCCFRRPGRRITCRTCTKQVGPGCCMAWESPCCDHTGQCFPCWTRKRVWLLVQQFKDSDDTPDPTLPSQAPGLWRQEQPTAASRETPSSASCA